ncbi:MAG: glycoside hydrolase family 140 protein [Devosia sp.]
MTSMKGVRLGVSDNGRSLTANGAPWLYVADTAWTLFKRLNRDEVEIYLTNRAAKGFSVIQAYVLRGLEVQNRDGRLPLVDRDPTRLDEGFFGNIDWIVNRANELGLAMGLVATQGEHVKKKVNAERFKDRDEQIFNKDNAFTFGANLGRRYRDNAVVWLLGGDRSPSAEDVVVWDAIARGMKQGSDGRHLVSYHSSGAHSSSEYFHQFDWLDLNTVQSRHGSGDPNYEYIATDYSLTPVKPTLDMECRYEDHPDGALGNLREIMAGMVEPTARVDAFSARQAGYWATFAGAAGHGYGHNSIWQLHDPANPVDSRKDYSFPLLPPTKSWREAMDDEGAFGIGHLATLLHARPWHETFPDRALVRSMQGPGEDRTLGLTARDGSFAMIYLSYGNPVRIDTDRIRGDHVVSRWFDPRTGRFSGPEAVHEHGLHDFTAPSSGRGNDWVLVLEGSKRGFDR